MEVMEDGNLMDKVHILIQRDMEYYKSKQTVLQELICPGIIGGRLDFPRSASFAAMKLVLWWEEEFVAAYRKPSGFLQPLKDSNSSTGDEKEGGCGGIVKASDPVKFTNLISKSADQFLEHLHVLTQEALDHADLTVLTGTIGAAALLKNCLWIYMQANGENRGPQTELLQTAYKKYHEMCEALAERLLDLHTRLISLYILQDAECLDWENEKAFSESERGSYVIQMWWLYMQGTKDDLWNTVPPKMAQRVFSGMLNESLTILTVRYTQISPSPARSALLIVDISNLLLCIGQLLPAICETAEEYLGINLTIKSKILRDIHVKCQDLFVCLLLRGCPLDELFKIFKKGIDGVEMFKSKTTGPSIWILFALPNIFKHFNKNTLKLNELNGDVFIALELMVLLAQPQPNWALLLKVLCLEDCKVLRLISDVSVSNFHGQIQRKVHKKKSCGAFLCPSDGSCKNIDTSTVLLNGNHYYELILSASDVVLNVGNNEDLESILLPLIRKSPNWAQCFERRQVWNQIRPPWYEAILHLTSPILPSVSETVINAIQTGASIYQAMSIVLAFFSQFWSCVNPILTQIASMLQDIIPNDITPLNNSALIQILISALYSEMLQFCEDKETVRFSTPNKKNSITSLEPAFSSVENIALAVAEALCTIDEDNKHTDQLEEFLEQVKDNLFTCDFSLEGCKRVDTMSLVSEVLVSDLLATKNGKHSLKTLHHFIKSNYEWLFKQLGVSESENHSIPNRVFCVNKSLLHTMFHIGYRPFDQLLTGDWKPDWLNLIQIPMGLTVERVWMQISHRWEFRDGYSSSLTTHDIQIVNYVSGLMKQ